MFHIILFGFFFRLYSKHSNVLFAWKKSEMRIYAHIVQNYVVILVFADGSPNNDLNAHTAEPLCIYTRLSTVDGLKICLNSSTV